MKRNYNYVVGLDPFKSQVIQAFFCRTAENLKSNNFKTKYQVKYYMSLNTEKSEKIVFYDTITNKLYQTNEFNLVRMFEYYASEGICDFELKW